MLSVEQKKAYHKEVFGLAIHASLQELFAIFANMLNSIMLSFVGQKYLSATTLAGQYVSIYMYSSLGLTLAVLMLATQYFGKNDTESIKKIMHISLLFSFILSFLFFIAAFLFPIQILTIITNDAELITIGAEYLKIFSFVFLFNAFSKIYMTILKAMGKVKINTIISVIANISNFLISLVLIFGFMTGKPLNAIGAAMSSALAGLIEMLLFLFYSIFFGKIKFSLIGLFKIDFFFAKEIFKYSIPVIFNKFSWSMADTLLTAVMGHMSRDTIDAFAFMKMLSNVPNSLLSGFGIAFGIVIGHALGKGDTKLAKAYGDDGFIYSIRTAIASFALMMILGVGGMFISKTPEAAFIAYLYMAIMFAYKFFGGALINYLNNGPFTAGGEVEFLALVDIVNMWIVMVPFTYLFFYILKLPEWLVLIFIFANEWTKLIPVYSHYKKYVWARDLTVNEWFLPIEGSFIDKYKRNLKLRFNISLSEFFTKRFENTTDFIFSLKKNKLSDTLSELQKYLEGIEVDKTTAYKMVLAMEELFASSGAESADIGVKLKDNKVRFIYYDNGENLKNILEDKSKVNIQIIQGIADKIEYKKALNLNKVLIRINR